MNDFQIVEGFKKLNNNNYHTSATCMMSYLEGHDLWEIIGRSETTPPKDDSNGSLCKQRIKAGKAIFSLKTTIGEEMLEHIWDDKTPKEAWDTFVMLFSKKNNTPFSFFFHS